MRIQISEDELALLSEMQQAGIPIDGDVLEAVKTSKRGLSLYQIGTNVDTRVFELMSGECAYMLSIEIDNDSDQVVRLVHAQLQMPWSDPYFRWLENPLRKSPREYTYSFPKNAPEGFELEVVLNHRIGRGTRFYPGEPMEGLLLGLGPEPIPQDYQHRQKVQGKLTIFDTRDNGYSTDVVFMVNRERQRQAVQIERSLRQELLPAA